MRAAPDPDLPVVGRAGSGVNLWFSEQCRQAEISLKNRATGFLFYYVSGNTIGNMQITIKITTNITKIITANLRNQINHLQ